MTNVKVEYLFPSQVVFGELENFEEIQDDLIKWIYSFKKENPGIDKISNRTGWQSKSKRVYQDEGFKQFQEPIINLIRNLTAEYKILNQISLVQMWININGPNAYNVSHRHPGCELSGCLWIKCPPESGRFVFDNMDNGYRDVSLLSSSDANYLIENRMVLEYFPEYTDGTMIIFPSSLTHRVELNETNEDRISISFNLKIDDVDLYEK